MGPGEAEIVGGGVSMKELIKELQSSEGGLVKALTVAVGHFDSKLNFEPDKTYTTREVQQLLDTLFEIHIKEESKKTRR